MIFGDFQRCQNTVFARLLNVFAQSQAVFARLFTVFRLGLSFGDFRRISRPPHRFLPKTLPELYPAAALLCLEHRLGQVADGCGESCLKLAACLCAPYLLATGPGKAPELLEDVVNYGVLPRQQPITVYDCPYRCFTRGSSNESRTVEVMTSVYEHDSVILVTYSEYSSVHMPATT